MSYIIHKQTKTLLFKKSTVIPIGCKSRLVSVGDKTAIQVKHDEDNVRLLWEAGFTDVLAPIEVYYDWPKLEGKFDPMPHQIKSATYLSIYRRAHNLSEPRVGKTFTTMCLFGYLKSIGEVDKLIVFSTISTMSTVWRQAVLDTFPELSCVVVSGVKASRQKLLEQDVDVYVLNHDSIKVLEKELTLKLSTKYLIVWDESDCLGNSQSAMWKAAYRVFKEEYRFIPMSGTPTGGDPSVIWGLARLVDKTKVPKYFGAWRSMVMHQPNKMYMPYKWVANSNANDLVYKALQPAICYRKQDVLKDLPPVSHERIECELTAEQTRMLKELQNEMAFECNGEKVLGVNGADKVTKGLQLLLGVFKKGDEYVSIGAEPRLEVVKDLIKTASKKVIIFCAFKGALHYYADALKKDYGVVVVDGDVVKDQRDEEFRKFTDDPKYVIGIFHPKCTGHGLEFSCADTIIWLGPMRGVRLFMQANERNNSVKQDTPTMIYYVGASQFEWVKYDKLISGKEDQNDLSDMYKGLLSEKFS